MMQSSSNSPDKKQIDKPKTVQTEERGQKPPTIPRPAPQPKPTTKPSQGK